MVMESPKFFSKNQHSSTSNVSHEGDKDASH